MANIPGVRRRSSKYKGLEPNLYPDPRKLASGDVVTYYRYKNPQSGVWTPFGRVTRERANSAARILNARLVPGADLVGKVLGTAGLNWSKILDRFEAEYPKWKTWGKRTAEEYQFKCNKFRKDLAARDFDTWLLQDLNTYIKDEFAGDGRIKARNVFIHIYAWACSEGICSENLAEKTLPPAAGKRRRQRMTPDLFNAVKAHKECPAWLACAMDLSLKTLQGGLEIALAEIADVGDGFLSFIRNKTKDITERAYIRVHIDAELQAILDRCKRLPVHGDRLIRRARKRKKKDAGASWSKVTRKRINEEFVRVRDLTGLVDSLPPERRPTFHEIRSLGARQLRKQLKARGWADKKAKEAANALLAHTSIRMTEHYLAGGEPEWTECQETPNISAT